MKHKTKYSIILTIIITTLSSNLCFASLDNNLVSHWKLDEGAGTTTTDYIGKDIGILTNDPRWTAGKLDKAIYFDGNDDRIDILSTNENSMNLNELTFTAWIYPAEGGLIYRKGDSPAYFNIYIIKNTSEFGIRTGYNNSSGAWQTQKPITLNKWHHIAISYMHADTKSNPVLYIDGDMQQINEVSSPSGTVVPDSSTTIIGNNPTFTSGFKGTIDEIRLYNKILTPSEIYHLYQPKSLPNIIVILTDDQDDMDSISVMNHLKSLIAEQGVTFRNSFDDFPLCCPNRASFLAGQRADNSAIMDNGPPEGGYNRFIFIGPGEENTLPVWLQEAGYKTALIGKYLNGYGAQEKLPVTHIPPGWDHWMALMSGGKYYNYQINENGVLHNYGSSQQDYSTDVLAQKAIDFITGQANISKPFFIWLTPNAPHTNVIQDSGLLGFPELPPTPANRHIGLFANTPLPLPPSFNEADISDKPSFMRQNIIMNDSAIEAATTVYRKTRETLQSVDEMVENVVVALHDTGKLDNTVIIYTSDNGFCYGQHRQIWGKRLVYEESIRVPLAIRAPNIARNVKMDQLVNNLDMVATILDYANATPRRVIDGRSFRTLLENSVNSSWRTALFVQGQDQAFYTKGYGNYQAIRTNRYLYAEHNSSEFGFERELYDLVADPYELESKHNDPEYKGIMTDLSVKLAKLKHCSGTSCWMTEPEPILQNRQGDVNNDGSVNIQDISIILADFSKTSEYNPRSDQNNDRKINLIDIMIVVKNWS